MSAAPGKFIDAAAVSTHYLNMGDKGTPVVLIHGGGAGAGAYTNWSGCMAAFAKEHRVFAPDMVGFGDSGKPDPATFAYSQDDRIEWLAAFIRALNVGPVALVGNSMGGAASIGVATRYPDLVTRLVLMGSAGVRLREGPSPELKSIQDYDFTHEGMVRMIKALTGEGYKPDEATVRYRVEMSLRPENRKAYTATMAWARQHGLHFDESVVSAVSQPTLVVAGKQDKVVPLSSAYRFLELIKQSWGWFVPGCGHWVMIERPKEFCAITLPFLADNAVA